LDDELLKRIGDFAKQKVQHKDSDCSAG